jgi:hypothetical protein
LDVRFIVDGLEEVRGGGNEGTGGGLVVRWDSEVAVASPQPCATGERCQMGGSPEDGEESTERSVTGMTLRSEDREERQHGHEVKERDRSHTRDRSRVRVMSIVSIQKSSMNMTVE